MQIDKQQVLDLLRDKGRDDLAQQAEGLLPDQIDTDQMSDLLSKYGVDVQGLIGRLGGSGGLGGLLGGG